MFNRFKNKKIIITGHTGFKGSWLTLGLNLLGAKIIGISIDKPSKPSHFEKLNTNKNELYESKLLKLNSTKARKKLKWVPILNFAYTVKMTTVWYKNFMQKKINVFNFSKKQIEDYIKRFKD